MMNAGHSGFGIPCDGELQMMLETLPPPAISPPQLPPADITGLYLHVPFCFHKCHYCDFYSITRQTPDRMIRFVDLMLREADQWAGGLASPFVPRTIFIGGGTPTLLPLEQMQQLLREMRKRFDLSAVDEWTVEANPATVTADYCQMLRENGVTRLSFGAQSFNADELKTLERHHNPDDVFRSVELARAAGFDRLNLDLIFAIPGQTLASWQHSVAASLEMGTTHLSCYALTYEANTPMAVRRRLGQFKPAAEELELSMLYHTRDRLTSLGIAPYEISNFAAPSQPCRHNLNYWTGGNYIGIGPSAASHVEGVRWKNRPHLGEWETAVESGNLPAIEAETLTPRQRAGELAMLMLRLETGLDLEFCTQRTGVDATTMFGPAIDRLIHLKLVTITDQHIRLTRQGIAVADAVAAEFLFTA
jgi:oxygen-independent coproporphyrinogen-3 oxidase